MKLAFLLPDSMDSYQKDLAMKVINSCVACGFPVNYSMLLAQTITTN